MQCKITRKPKSRYIPLIRVFQHPLQKSLGLLVAGGITIQCALGRTGTTHNKREGDGATPLGVFSLHRLWFRDDHGPHPLCGLNKRRIRESDGWCDDVRSRRYNRAIRRPFAPSHEIMMRDDYLYDFVIEIGWNLHPIRRGRGSAIFLHLARDNFAPTAGCVAVKSSQIRRLLTLIGPRTRIEIR